MPLGTEVLVVDDASPDGIASRLAAHWPGVRALPSPGRGFCNAVNAGVAESRGVIVEVLNDDTEVTSGWAEPALECFRDPAVAAVAPLVLQGTPRSGQAPRVDSAGDRYYLGGVAGKRGHGEALTCSHLQAGPVFGASASSAFYRRSALVHVGGFPEHFGAYFEDVDLAFRLNRAGYRSVFEPASRVFHRVGASYGQTNRRLLEQQSRNEELVFWRNLPTADLRRALPRHLAVLAGKAWRRWEEGSLIPFLCGRVRLLGEVGDVLRHRRWLQHLGPGQSVTAWGVEERFWARPKV